MSDIKKQVGQQIKEVRKQKGLTQKELGLKMGLSESVINKYEGGKQNLSLETVQKIAAALDVGVTALIKE